MGRYPKVKWVFGPDVSMFENWRACLDAATSDYVAIPSDDDLYLPRLGFVLKRLSPEQSRADVIIAGHLTIDGDGKTLSEWRPPRAEIVAPPYAFPRFQFGVPARMPSVFFRNSFLRSIGSLDPTFQLTAADSDLVQRALLKGTVAFIPESVAAYRVWPGALTHSTQMSDLWMREIDKWAARIAPVATQECGNAGLPFDPDRFVDELYATNLIAGMRRCVAPGKHADALRFFLTMRKPWHARPRTRLFMARLLARLLAGALLDRAAAMGAQQRP